MRRGQHRQRRQLFRRDYILAYDYDARHRGWWRLRWPEGRPHHRIFS